jgi:hypothetical protein
MARDRPEPQDETDRTIFGHLDRVGWAVICIPDDDEGPGFAYSLGLYETHGHPEVILIGMKTQTMYDLVNWIGKRVALGHRFEPGMPVEEVINKFAVWFLPVAGQHYREYLGYANWYYGSTTYPALQCVWPDMEGRLPWDEGVHPGIHEKQPLLGHPPPSDHRNEP